MALSYSDVAEVKNQPQRFGQLNARIVDVQMDNSYPSPGGEEIVESKIGFTKVYGGAVIGITNGATDGTVTSAIIDCETAATPKLVCYDGGSEVANGVDLSGIKLRIMFFGK